MSQGNTVGGRNKTWSPAQAYVLATICLVLGLVVGFFLRGSSGESARAVSAANAAPAAQMPSQGQVTPEQLKHMADQQAKPMLEQLNRDPGNRALLVGVGNIYYDAQQFQDAIGYYERALKIDGNDVNVRTDMGTAYWYLGDAQRAVQAFTQVLKIQPSHAQAMFNLGVVKWQGQSDPKGAIAVWQKLLETNPNYPERQKVEQLIAHAEGHPKG